MDTDRRNVDVSALSRTRLTKTSNEVDTIGHTMTDSDVRTGRYQTWETADLAAAIGHTIRVLRTDQGLSRAELAKQAGISYSYLSAIENGTKPPSTKIQLVLAEALGMKVHELLQLAESRTAPAPRLRRVRSVERSRLAADRYDASYDETMTPTTPRPVAASRVITAPLMDRDPHREAMQLRARAEFTELIAEMREPDIEFLLEMARKLSGRPRS